LAPAGGGNLGRGGRGEQRKGAMRMDGVVVLEPAGQLVEDCSGVGLVGDADVVALHGPHERFGHAV